MTEPVPATTAVPTNAVPTNPEDPTIGKLVVDVSRNVSALVQQEIQLAKSELQVSAKAGAMSIAMFAAAGFVAVLAIIMLSVGFAYLINLTGLGLVWCFLIVAAVYFLIAAVLGLIGKSKMGRVKGPERAIHQAQETKTALKRG